ncbi:MAG: MFS transporter [Caulobacteraceae bacterium]|nr:MFS transporter [Caulobacteraceae bacterium]
MSKIEWRPQILLAVFSLVGFLINASTFSSLGVVLPKMVAEQGWSWQQAGLGFTILGAACGSSSYFPALMIRRFGVRVTLIAGSAVMIGGFACLAATHGLMLYFIGAALCGVGYQMMALIPATHVLAAVFKQRGKPFGVYFTASALGGVAGPWLVLGVLKVSHDQWREFWQLQVVLSAILGVISAALVGGRDWLAKVSERTDQEVAEEISVHAKGRVYRTLVNWTVKEAVRTPQFYVLLAAYFGHLLVGVTVASLSVAHLTERGVAATMAGAMLSLEALVQTGGRAVGGLISDYLEPRLLLIFALACLMVGAGALSVAHDLPMMLLYAVGSGLGFGLTALAVTVLVLNYFGRKHNLEIFSLTCMVGAVSALGPTIGGTLRDQTGSFGSTFQIYAAVIAVVFFAALFMRPPKHRSEQDQVLGDVTPSERAPGPLATPTLAQDPA